MEETRKTSSRRLVKRERLPPPVAYLNNKSSTLKRAPSAASYFTPNQGLGLPSPSTSLSADTQTPGSSLRRSPSLTPVHEHQRAAANVKYPPAQAPAPSFAHLPPASVGEPFNAIVEEALNASSYSYTTATAGPRRPAGPQHSQTADQPSRFRSPKLRQSASFNTLARKMDTPPSGTKSPRNRYSDDGDLAKKRRSDGGKKKGTFSTFMSSMLGSPRRPTISTPTNPMHVTHVSIDNETGEFTVRGTTTQTQCARLVVHACAVTSIPFPSCLSAPRSLANHA